MKAIVVYFCISLVLMIYFAFDSLGQRLENQQLREEREIEELECSILQHKAKR